MVNRAVILKFIDFINLQYFIKNCNTMLIHRKAAILCLHFQ